MNSKVSCDSLRVRRGSGSPTDSPFANESEDVLVGGIIVTLRSHLNDYSDELDGQHLYFWQLRPLKSNSIPVFSPGEMMLLIATMDTKARKM